MTPTTMSTDDAVFKPTLQHGASIPLDAIDEPGTYVCNWSGHLLRIAGGLRGAAVRAPFNLVGPEPLFVTKISDDPQEAVARARALARQLALRANF